MAFQFRSVRDLTNDLRDTLKSLVDDADAPLLRDVTVCRASPFPKLAGRLDRIVRAPAAAICAGPATLPERGLRHVRTTVFDVYLLGAFDGDADRDGALAIHDLAHAVQAWFLPSSSGSLAPRRIADVGWEVVEAVPVDEPNRGVLRLRLLATDRLRERE